MFSHQNRCIYDSNCLAEVICQLRFPEILAIRANLPVEFQEAIRAEFPQFHSRQEAPPPVPMANRENKTEPTINYQFSSPDGSWRINLTSRFISLSTSRYTDWEAFAAKLDRPLSVFIQIYKPAYFERIGLRYLNFISRKDLGLEGVPFSQLIQPCYLGPLAEEDISESGVTRCSIDTEMSLRGGCKLKLHAGPGLVKKNNQPDSEIKFILDEDLFMPGNVPINLSAGSLQTLHAQADSVFRGAITNTLHNAMGPNEI